jgi:hypothetical protein
MSKPPKKENAPPKPEESEVCHDPIGVTHFLLPKRCKTCDD